MITMTIKLNYLSGLMYKRMTHIKNQLIFYPLNHSVNYLRKLLLTACPTMQQPTITTQLCSPKNKYQRYNITGIHQFCLRNASIIMYVIIYCFRRVRLTLTATNSSMQTSVTVLQSRLSSGTDYKFACITH